MARHDAPAAGDPMARPQDLPSVDRLLRLPAVQTMVADHGHTLVAGECRALLDTLRGRALAGADARRAEIILNGLSADVVRSVENGKVWYRVVSGPYDSAEAAIIAQQTLQNSGIDSIVVKR